MNPIRISKSVRASSTEPTCNQEMEKANMKLRIKKRYSQLQNSLTVTCGILLVLCAFRPMFGQQTVSNQLARTTSVAIPPAPTPAAAKSRAAQDEEPAAQTGQGGSGIKIHGHWKFVVHNADGTLASSREFENSLITPASGDFLLASALLGQTVPVDWGVILCPVAGTDWGVPPYISGRFLQGTICPGSNDPVAILVPSFTTIVGSIMSFSNFCSGTSNSPCVTGMTQALSGGTSSSPGYSITLSGNYTSPAATTINAVGTYLGYCPVVGAGQFNTTSAASCEGEGISLPRFNPPATSPSLLPFTGTNQTQSLAAGQILTVTVTISFS